MSSSSFRPLSRRAGLLGAVLALAIAAPADAHTVQPGETLSSIASANGMQIARLAAANGLPWNAQVIAGQNLQIPPADGVYTSTTGETMGYSTSTVPLPGSKRALAAASSGSSAGSAAGSASSSTPSASGASSSASSTAGSGSRVQPGDTLSAIAARLGVSLSALAAANGIADPNLVISGTTLRHPGATTTVTPAPAAVPATSSTGPEGNAAVQGSGATTTAERLSSSQISSIAAQHGVPGSLAAAIAWQESGNNNAMVSSAGARGVMQIMPGTWDWIDSSLASPPLNRASANDNVRAGSLFLRQLLKESGGDEATAIAGYYQGLGSVRQRGLYDDTKQYVRNVQALRGRFGG